MTGFSEKDREEVDAQDASDRAEIARLQKDGHTRHCSYRLIYGDGECECSKSQGELVGVFCPIGGGPPAKLRNKICVYYMGTDPGCDDRTSVAKVLPDGTVGDLT